MADLARGGAVTCRKPNAPTHVPATGLILTRRAEEHRHLPWLEDYLAWLEGKETDREYYAWLEQVAPWWDVEKRATEETQAFLAPWLAASN